MCSKIGLIKRGFRFIKRLFYYRNKWSSFGPDKFGLKRVSLSTVGLQSGDYCISKTKFKLVSDEAEESIGL